jgi:hypothetical protein
MKAAEGIPSEISISLKLESHKENDIMCVSQPRNCIRWIGAERSG